MPKTEQELQLKRLREMANAILASSAFSDKEEKKQLERITSQLKYAENAHDAGVLGDEALEAKRELTDRELALIRRIWSLRRKIATELIEQVEGELDAMEGDTEAA